MFPTVARFQINQVSAHGTAWLAGQNGFSGDLKDFLEKTADPRIQVRGLAKFSDDDCDALIRDLFFKSELPEWKIHIPNVGMITGIFQITSIEYCGSLDAQISLDNAGLINFSPAK